MPREQTEGKTTFVIRLWLEPREREEAASPEWRWHVQHVQSGDQAYFHRIQDLMDYVEMRSGHPSPH